ncbi:hypothetical protein HBB16_02295 [Pseudonocardia sp. MCCB 268]|nr:hypothetical protein [Pseudonocardia cytotoxica]
MELIAAGGPHGPRSTPTCGQGRGVPLAVTEQICAQLRGHPAARRHRVRPRSRCCGRPPAPSPKAVFASGSARLADRQPGRIDPVVGECEPVRHRLNRRYAHYTTEAGPGTIDPAPRRTGWW